MAVTLRFHGRFLYGERPDGSFEVMAPAFGPEFRPHRALMSVAQMDLQFHAQAAIGTARPQITTLDPMIRTASHHDEENPQVLIWDLSGLRVSYEAATPVTLGQEPQIVALETLEEARAEGGGAELDSRALTADPHGRTQAVVKVSAGTGTAVANVEAPMAFVKAADVGNEEGLSFAKTPGAESDLTIMPADLVKFLVEPPATAQGTHLTLKFSSASEAVVGMVSVKDGGTVSFSNLCAPIHEPGATDLEFVQYYDLLQDSPGMDGLVPHEATGNSEGPCCVCAARIRIPVD